MAISEKTSVKSQKLEDPRDELTEITHAMMKSECHDIRRSATSSAIAGPRGRLNSLLY